MLLCLVHVSNVGTVQTLADLTAQDGTEQRARGNGHHLAAATADLRARKAANAGTQHGSQLLLLAGLAAGKQNHDD